MYARWFPIRLADNNNAIDDHLFVVDCLNDVVKTYVRTLEGRCADRLRRPESATGRIECGMMMMMMRR
jgi:hypothetical protein